MSHRPAESAGFEVLESPELQPAPIAAQFHINTKFSRYRSSPLPATDDAAMPMYGAADHWTALDGVPLERERRRLGMPLSDVISARRSTRTFMDAPITAADLGTILRYSAGSVRPGGDDRGPFGRAAPSGGARYPIDLKVVTANVDGLAPGVHHYDVDRHALVAVAEGTDAVKAVRAACLYPDYIADAAVVILMVGVMIRTTIKYGDNGYRLAVLECGHIGQNICLTATALGLGSLCLAGFDEHDVEALLGIDGQTETLLYSVLVGHAAGT